MTTGFSLFLIAVGAILTWAVEYTVAEVDIAAVGVILMLVGAVGLLMSLLMWSSFSPFPRESPFVRRTGVRQDTAVVHHAAPQPDTVVVRESAPPPRVIVRETEAPHETVVIRESSPPAEPNPPPRDAPGA